MPFPQAQLRDLEGPDDLLAWAQDVQRAYASVAALLTAGLHVGDPTHPVSTTNHPNGHLQNFDCSFATVEFTATDTATTVTHNLNQSTTGTASNTKPNVIWLVVGLKHDGTGTTGAADTMTLEYEEGDTITADSIQLRIHAGGPRTVDGTHPVTAVLCFFGVTPW